MRNSASTRRSSNVEARKRMYRRRRLLVALLAVTIVALGVGAFAVISSLNSAAVSADSPDTAGETTEPKPEPTPLSAEEQLLADAGDPLACAVSFEGDGIAQEPMLQSQNTLYAALPIPAQDGRVFAGWYTSPEAAGAYQVDARVNGSELVTCTDQRMVLHAAWMSPEENAAADSQIPILMYHQFTSRPEGEDGWLRGNYAYIGDFDAQMNHIATTGFYMPTWDELSAFIDGRLFLPNRSVIITDDDADQTWFDLAVPVVDKYQVLSTSFMVTAYRQDPAPSPFVLRRSHTHDMHQAGANGDGLMVNWTAEEIAADLNTSGDILGVREVIAYPYGHHNDTAKQGVAMAGYEMARTIEPGRVQIGTDKLALPVVRIDYGMGLDALINQIG
ncbi:polysaccharide deacetylase family protein [Microbacterium sp.]|uniref:polysaccharide deacetylase family protein n=1 Tax=Microbacterium sp. TaxID=51671 RepID=UPI0027346902|nr:polysaccharide deacetylase family protein [Microbacterium sp.]MDP3950455.1 polysaccharide deacetylase family protein [Microbacterium sp.]